MMPDIANEGSSYQEGRLDKVGMTEIEIPVWVRDDSGQLYRSPAKGQAYVSLDDSTAKGIHMSRLFLLMQETLEYKELSVAALKELLIGFIESHVGLSHSSFVQVDFDYLVKRPALKSQYKAWRSYPVSYRGFYNQNKFEFEVAFSVVYSSTCPCSAALARQLIQDQFKKDFGSKVLSHDEILNWLGSEKGIVATPHSQRSFAEIRLKIQDVKGPFDLVPLIDQVESALGTPVQAAVKREDEQEFALLNGQNLMFCEDAARKIKTLFLKENSVSDFWIKVSHVESLHPHNAVSVATKGVVGGYTA